LVSVELETPLQYVTCSIEPWLFFSWLSVNNMYVICHSALDFLLIFLLLR